jgi:hypothetical protein
MPVYPGARCVVAKPEAILIQLTHPFGWAEIEERIFLAQGSRTTNTTMRFRPPNANSGLGEAGRYTQTHAQTRCAGSPVYAVYRRDRHSDLSESSSTWRNLR